MLSSLRETFATLADEFVLVIFACSVISFELTSIRSPAFATVLYTYVEAGVLPYGLSAALLELLVTPLRLALTYASMLMPLLV